LLDQTFCDSLHHSACSCGSNRARVIYETQLKRSVSLRFLLYFNKLGAFHTNMSNRQRMLSFREVLFLSTEDILTMEKPITNAIKADILESTPSIIAFHDTDQNILWANKAYRKATGLSLEQLKGKKCYIVWGLSQMCRNCPVTRSLQTGEYAEAELTPDNQNHWPVTQGSWLTSAVPVRAENGQLVGIIENAVSISQQKNAEKALKIVHAELEKKIQQRTRDLADSNEQLKKEIEGRKQVEEALRESERRYKRERDYMENLFQNSADPIAIFNEYGRIIRWNKRAAEWSGYDFDEIQGMHFSVFHADQAAMEGMLAELREQDAIHEYEISLVLKNGRTTPCSISVSKIYDEKHRLIGSVNIIRDLTEWKKAQQKLEEVSYFDALTGLYNRTFFEEEMRRLADDRYCPIGLLVCDIDGLKLINDTLGHGKGDELVSAVGRILKQCFRGSDIAARVGGDEFAVILPNSGKEVVQGCSDRVRLQVAHFNNQAESIGLSLSVGYAVEDKPPLDMNALFKRADDAMYKEKLQQSYSSRSETMRALIKTLEARDHITEGHARRLHLYAQQLGQSLGLSEERLYDLQLLARFHDLGKVGVPDRILFKPDRLTDEEFEEMKRHCEIGHRIALSLSDLAPIADQILKHHEWWNGLGYPLGLSGKEIPLECRILAIVDAYDTMTSERPYKGPLSDDEAIQELRRCSGTQFDRELTETFIQLLREA